MKSIYCLILLFFSSLSLFGQGSPDYNGGLKIKLDEDGKKYVRMITWAQVQANMNFNAPDDVSPVGLQLRRARVLLFSQFSKRFMILTHFGLNSLGANTLSPTGKGSGSQLFMHDAWIQYNLSSKHSVGAGLHYFNGISRLNNQSTLNMLTLDNNRESWATIGLTDQFARHIGVFAKGSFGQLQYQVAVNNVSASSLDGRSLDGGNLVYQGRAQAGSGKAGYAYAGYFSYNLWDQESNFLPFKVGTYLGGKRVFNIGAGFFMHPNGVAKLAGSGIDTENVSLFAVDAFYDAPVGDDGSAITAYAVAQFNNYGENYSFGPYSSGTMVYSHLGYALPGNGTVRWQPYVSYMHNAIQLNSTSKDRVGVGVNAFMSGHNSKVTFEYFNTSIGDVNNSGLNVQAMIYI